MRDPGRATHSTESGPISPVLLVDARPDNGRCGNDACSTAAMPDRSARCRAAACCRAAMRWRRPARRPTSRRCKHPGLIAWRGTFAARMRVQGPDAAPGATGDRSRCGQAYPELWQALSMEQRSRFLRHLRPWWEVHRHRMPPQLTQRIEAARARGQLHVIAARIIGCIRSGRRRPARPPAADPSGCRYVNAVGRSCGQLYRAGMRRETNRRSAVELVACHWLGAF